MPSTVLCGNERYTLSGHLSIPAADVSCSSVTSRLQGANNLACPRLWRGVFFIVRSALFVQPPYAPVR